MTRPVSVLAPIAIVLVGILLLDVMGVLIRILSATYPVEQLAAFRNLFGMVPSILLLMTNRDWHARGRPLRIRQWRLALLRGVFVAFAQFCYYTGLTLLAFATVSTLAFAAPLVVTALSRPVLGESVGPWRWAAVVIGFAGVVLVMGPGTDAFTLAALLPLGAAIGYGTASVAVRLIDHEVPSPLVNLYANLAAMVGAIVLTISVTQPVPLTDWQDLALIFAMGCSGGSGVLCLTIAYRMATPSLLAPFEYTGILFAFVLGWVVFAEAPVDRLFPGVLLIVGAGLLIIWREQRGKLVSRPRAPRRMR